MKIKKLVAMGAALGVAVAGLALGAAPANAEPVSGSYVMVGSDTLQDAANALANGTSVGGSTIRTVTSNGKTVASFDAFGSTAIQTKPNGPYFGRPAGSGAGVNALRASILGTGTYSGNTAVPARNIAGQVDIARSSSGPGANENANGLLSYIPFARDAVSYAYRGDSAALGALTKEQLKQIYSSNTAVEVNGVTVTALLPQSGSGTRNFFIQALDNTSIGSSVKQATVAGVAFPENDASALTADGMTNVIIPFSAASWIAQSNGVTGVSTIGTTGAQLGSINGVAPFTSATTGGVTTLTASKPYYDSAFGRDTYLVVERARVSNPTNNPKYDAALAALVDPTKATSLTNFGALSSTSGAAKAKFGFLKPSSDTILFAYAAL